MDLKLQGKVALVTGSSRGIGLAIAQALAAEGSRVVLNGRDSDILTRSAQPLGGRLVVGDVTTADGACRVINEALSLEGRLDVLVANVGSGISVAPGLEDHAEWERMLNINLLSATNTVSAARKALASSHGVVLCVSSICGLAALGASLAYSGAKAALNSYVHGICPVLAQEGVRINGLAPGNVLFQGSTWERKLLQDSAGVQRMLDLNVPMRRLALPSEIADVAVFLCSARSSFMTGTVVVVDGGQTKL